MPIPYRGNYFYPPRSNIKVPYSSPVVSSWKRYEDAIAQLKLNGTNTQVKVLPDQTIELWTRHRLDQFGKDHPTGTPQRVKLGNKGELYELPTKLRDEILAFSPRGQTTIYNAELMNSRTKTVKDILYFFDVLVWESQHLIGIEYKERFALVQNILKDRFIDIAIPRQAGMLCVAQNLMPSQWDAAWAAAQSCDYCEGLVLKRTGGVSRLANGDRVANNCGFLCRVRKPTKNARY